MDNVVLFNNNSNKSNILDNYNGNDMQSRAELIYTIQASDSKNFMQGQSSTEFNHNHNRNDDEFIQ